MKTVNLEEILIEKCAKRRWHLSPDFKADLISAMREACNQTLDLADEESLKVKDDVYDSSVILNLKSQII